MPPALFVFADALFIEKREIRAADRTIRGAFVMRRIAMLRFRHEDLLLNVCSYDTMEHGQRKADTPSIIFDFENVRELWRMLNRLMAGRNALCQIGRLESTLL